MKAYKGFNKDMKCRGFQFEEGKEYEEPTAKVCESGFHACKMPLECFSYYKPTDSVYHEVDQNGEISDSGEGTKVASTKIKIGARLDIKKLVKAQIEFVFDKVKNPTSGDWSSAATSGDWSSAATSSFRSSAATLNKNSIALACGKNAKAKGVLGSYVVLTEWNEEKTILISAKMAQIDGEKIKADTWYKLEHGEFVEVSGDDE